MFMVEIGIMVEIGMFTVEIEVTVEIGMFTVEIEITVEIGMFMVEIEIPDLSGTIPGQAMESTESHHVGLPSPSFSVTCSLCLGCVDMLLILLHLYCVHWVHFRCKYLKNTLLHYSLLVLGTSAANDCLFYCHLCRKYQVQMVVCFIITFIPLNTSPGKTALASHFRMY